METIKLNPPEGYKYGEVKNINGSLETTLIKAEQENAFEDYTKAYLGKLSTTGIGFKGNEKQILCTARMQDVYCANHPPIEWCWELRAGLLHFIMSELDGEWKPDWEDERQCKYYPIAGEYRVAYSYKNGSFVAFRNSETYQKFINIVPKEFYLSVVNHK